MAKMPDQLIKPKNRTVKDLQRGERAQVALCMIAVDHDNNAFVFANAELAPPMDEDLEYGDIWLDERGKYHVDLRNTTNVWEPRELPGSKTAIDWLKPLESIRWTPSADTSPGSEPNRDGSAK